MDHLRYPIGHAKLPEKLDLKLIDKQIHQISEFPKQVKDLIAGISNDDYNKTYRPGGWNLFQLVHHVADSHTNAFIRFKWALTEDKPLIKAYEQADWATTPDVDVASIDIVLNQLDGLHQRWCYLMRIMDEADWNREWVHPETG